jgi:hypothetical protein
MWSLPNLRGEWIVRGVTIGEVGHGKGAACRTVSPAWQFDTPSNLDR